MGRGEGGSHSVSITSLIFWVSLAAVSCAFKLAYIFYNQNLHEEAGSVCELFCERLRAADAYACPEIPPERVSASLILSARNGAEPNGLIPAPGRQRRGWDQLFLLEQPRFPALRPSLGGGAAVWDMRGGEFALKPFFSLCALPAAAQMLQAAGGELPQAGAAGESAGVRGAVAGGAAGPDRGAAGRTRFPLGQSQNRRCETRGRGVTVTVRPGRPPGACWGWIS